MCFFFQIVDQTDVFLVAGLNITGTINDVDDTSDDDDSDFEPNEETVLESYTTPLDEENCDVDEYIAFKQVFTSKYLISTDIHTFRQNDSYGSLYTCTHNLK